MKKVFNPEKKSWSSLIKRPLYSFDSVKDIVDEIFTNVELYGDKSLIKYTNKFDKVDLNNLIVSEKKINNSECKDKDNDYRQIGRNQKFGVQPKAETQAVQK